MSELYTIIKKYHEKKETNFWLVRLDVKVDREILDELKDFVEEFSGYHTCVSGVNWFVFKTKKNACLFGKKLDDYLYVVDDEIEVPQKVKKHHCNVKDFYHTERIVTEDGYLYCVYFDADKFVGNPDFAIFRQIVENVYFMCGYVKLAYGIGFYTKSDRDSYVRMINSIKL